MLHLWPITLRNLCILDCHWMCSSTLEWLVVCWEPCRSAKLQHPNHMGPSQLFGELLHSVLHLLARLVLQLLHSKLQGFRNQPPAPEQLPHESEHLGIVDISILEKVCVYLQQLLLILLSCFQEALTLC